MAPKLGTEFKKRAGGGIKKLTYSLILLNCIALGIFYATACGLVFLRRISRGKSLVVLPRNFRLSLNDDKTWINGQYRASHWFLRICEKPASLLVFLREALATELVFNFSLSALSAFTLY